MYKTLAIVASVALPLSAQAGVIDNRPGPLAASYQDTFGADTAGGSFFADASRLDSFTLDFLPGGTGTVSVIVMNFGVSGPDTILWQTSPFDTPTSNTALTFEPGISLTPGSEYYIGIDSGVLTDANGSFNFRFSADTIAGQFWDRANGNPFRSFDIYDLAARIVMSDAAEVPAPAALGLLGFGLAGAAALRRRRSLR